MARPDGLPDDVRAVWDRLAPLALAQRTLTPATASRFALLCRAIVMERAMGQQLLAEGWTYVVTRKDGSETRKAHPLCAPHRGLMQRVETGLLAFCLAPNGQPVAADPAVKPQTALEALQARRHLRVVPPTT